MSLRRILVVDDDHSTQEFIRLSLADEGYDIALADNGADALRLIESFRPDLIILDMRMPVLSGPDFLALYRRNFERQVPVVGMSVSRKLAARADDLSVDAFLPKPFNLDDLLQCVEKYMRTSV